MAAADQDATHGVTVREIPAGFEKAHATPETYKAMYAESINDPDAFWGREGKRLDWIKPYTRVKDTDFTFGKVSRSFNASSGSEKPLGTVAEPECSAPTPKAV